MAKLIDMDFNEAAGASKTADQAGPTLEHGVFMGDATTTGDGAATFDGSVDYVEIAPDPSLALSQGTVTFDFFTNTASGKDTLFSVDSSGFDKGGHLMVQVNANQIMVRHQTDTESFFYSGGTISDGVPATVAYSWGPTGSVLVVNGVVVDTGSIAHTLAGDMEPMIIGSSQMSSGDGVADNMKDNFNGEIARFRLYDEEIAAAGPLPCFRADTRVETPTGTCRVDDLVPGDLVLTQDSGPKPIRKVLTRTVSAVDMAAFPHLRPVHIPQGVLGATAPLVLSRQHGLAVPTADGLCLIRAGHACTHYRHGIRMAAGCKRIDYVHLLFDAHHIVTANGVAAETLYLGPEVLKARPELGQIARHPRRVLPLLSGPAAKAALSPSTPLHLLAGVHSPSPCPHPLMTSASSSISALR